MSQFFTEANMRKFIAQGEGLGEAIGGGISEDKLDILFDAFIEAVQASPLAGMLGLVGGVAVLEKIRDPFKEKMGEKIQYLARFGKIP